MEERSLWYPYAQMKTLSPPLEVVSASGCQLQLADGRELIDGISSWWAAIHGYNHPVLNQAIADQLGQMAHVMLGGLTHQPAQKLAEKLVKITPQGLDHVFFSDSGSVGVEIALKMAWQYHKQRGHTEKTQFIALTHAYHGDTYMAMSVGDDSDFSAAFSHVLRPAILVDPPYEKDQEEAAIQALKQLLSEKGDQIAAMIVEPILQGAGGFRSYSPSYLDRATQLCHAHDVLMIFDEVATGFGRTGKFFAADWCSEVPDIMVLGKALTAGYMGHAATLASTPIFNAFYSDNPGDAFMHGPTFMGNPLACAVGLAGIEVFQRENYLAKIAAIESQLNAELNELKDHPTVKRVNVLGGVGLIELQSASLLKGFSEFAAQNGVWLRGFENYLYTAPAYIISEAELSKITGVMKEWVGRW